MEINGSDKVSKKGMNFNTEKEHLETHLKHTGE
jgi:hypothetical protein